MDTRLTLGYIVFWFGASMAKEGEFQVNHYLDGLYRVFQIDYVCVFQIDYVCVFHMWWLVISDYGRVHSWNWAWDAHTSLFCKCWDFSVWFHHCSTTV